MPLSDAEVAYLAKNIRPLIDPKLGGHRRGGAAEPVAMVVTLPNLNEAIADLDGRLLPFGWAKLLWRLKVRTTKTMRMPLMGVRRQYHGTALGAALAFSVIDAARRHLISRGVASGELSWVLGGQQRGAPHHRGPGVLRLQGLPRLRAAALMAEARNHKGGEGAFTALVLAGQRPDDPLGRAQSRRARSASARWPAGPWSSGWWRP